MTDYERGLRFLVDVESEGDRISYYDVSMDRRLSVAARDVERLGRMSREAPNDSANVWSHWCTTTCAEEIL